MERPTIEDLLTEILDTLKRIEAKPPVQTVPVPYPVPVQPSPYWRIPYTPTYPVYPTGPYWWQGSGVTCGDLPGTVTWTGTVTGTAFDYESVPISSYS